MTIMVQRPRRWALAVLLLGSACLDLPPIKYETEKTIIGTDFELCPGDLKSIDRHVELVEDMLDAPSDEKLEIYIFPSVPPRCWGAFSCYDERRDMIRTHWSFLGHEIVHAVVDRFAQPPPFWNEGIAEALDRTASFGGTATVMESIHVSDWRDLDYLTAGHFVRQLLEDHDPALIKPILLGASFEHTYGVSFPAAAASYEEDHPYAYPPWMPCDLPPLPRHGDAWGEAVEVSCDALGGTAVEGASALSVVRGVELDSGRYTLETYGGVGTRLVGCHLGVFEEQPPPPPAMFHGDVPNEVEAAPTHFGRLFETGVVHELEITEPGLFKFIMMANEEGETVEVVLRPLD